jgi:uncharacterized protein (DUF488 family)
VNAQHHPIFTIGHSVHPIEVFLGLLSQHAVTAVADVRSAPYSRRNPQYNRDALEATLRDHRIHYVFLGRELGARSEDPTCYVGGRVQYARLAAAPLFRSGVDRVLQGARDHRIALMCSEKEPLECHRTILVAPAVAARGVEILHIHPDGHLERHENAMTRLLALCGLPAADLFHTRAQLVEDALVRQEEKIAYVDDRLAGASSGEGR